MSSASKEERSSAISGFYKLPLEERRAIVREWGGLSAEEAHAWGLVSEVVDADSLAPRAAELAARYAAAPTRGIGMTKRLFDHAEHATLEEQLEPEAQLQSAATKTADFTEGVAAFLEKREPRFHGR